MIDSLHTMSGRYTRDPGPGTAQEQEQVRQVGRDRSAHPAHAKPSPPPLVLPSSSVTIAASPLTSGSPTSASSPLMLPSSIPYSALSPPSSSFSAAGEGDGGDGQERGEGGGEGGEGGFGREIEALHELARSLRENLKMRPIRSSPPPPPTPPAPSPPRVPPKSQLRQALKPLDPPSAGARHISPSPDPDAQERAELRVRASGGSGAGETRTPPPPAAPPRLMGEGKDGMGIYERAVPAAGDSSSSASSTPFQSRSVSNSSQSSSDDASASQQPHMSVSAGQTLPAPISPSDLLALLPSSSALGVGPPRPLIIDTRPLPSFLHSRLSNSINLAIPSLILKRTLNKPSSSSSSGPGFASLDVLRGYITLDSCKDAWDSLLSPSSQAWSGDVVLYDDEMDESTRASVKALSTAWTLVTLLTPLVPRVHYLRGGFSALRTHPDARGYILSEPPGTGTPGGQEVTFHHHQQYNGGSPSLMGQELTVSSAGFSDTSATPRGTPGTARSSGSAGSGAGLFSLRTDVAARRGRTVLLELDPQPPALPAQPPMSARVLALPKLTDASPSPPPSATHFQRGPRRMTSASMEQLKLGFSGAAGGGGGLPSPMLPKLQLKCTPLRSATMPVPPSPGLLRITPPSPGAGMGVVQLNSPLPLSPLASPLLPPPSPGFPRPLTPPTHTQPTSLPPTPESATHNLPFTPSCIIPSFLYLGPEPQTDADVSHLLSLGIKRILNMAEECEDDRGLAMRRKFEMYERVPMRDWVDEVNVGRGVRAACMFLDDARLHDSPTYVHCKAGKSRSVTVVMGYLIHANHWPLSKAYAYVTEKRQGCSPNIGFVSELMKFEEAVLGGKSVGVVGAGEAGQQKGGGGVGALGMGMRGGRRGPHVRESLPPALLYRGGSTEDVMMHHGEEGDGEGEEDAVLLGDAATEMEVKDSEGRYVHARRVPVDRQTMQPQRRMSKAGLESAWVP